MRLLSLRLRCWMGWGLHPTYLRARGAGLLRAFVVAMIGTTGFIGVLWIIRPWIDSRMDPRGLVFAEIWIAGGSIVIVLIPSITSRLLARRGVASQIGSIYGRCFAAVADPPDKMFARIGASPETAEWYSLPLGWDTLVAPSEDQLELDVLEATGWVERVRRSGSHAGEVSRSAPTEEELRIVSHPPKPTPAEMREEREELQRETRGEASEEEQEEMRRYARQMSAGAAQTPRMIAVSAWSLVLLGILFASLLPVVLAILVVIQMYSPHSFHHTANDGAAFVSLFILLALFMIAGLGLMWYGVRLLRRSRRMRWLSEVPPESVTGELVGWMPYWDIWSSSGFQERGETLIKLRAADGSDHIFRVPIRYLHRVRRRGALVRVTYQPVAERVLDVAYAEEPVEAVPLDGPEHT